jgi:ankyrin repeat protein
MSKSKLQMPVPLLKTLDELEETTNDHNNNLSRNLEANKLNPDAKNKQKQSSIASTARSSSSITTISNTTNIKTKLKPPATNQPKKSSASSRKKSISDTSVDESVSEQSVQLVSLPRQGLDYEKLVPSQCDCDLLKLAYINSYEKYLIQRIFSSVGKLSSYMSDLSSVSLKHYLNTPDQNEFLPLYYAIKANNLTAVKYLISTGASLIKTTSHGDPAAHLACLVGCSSDLVDFLLECLDLDKMCANFDNLNSKENKSSLYKRDQEGWTVLHCACNQGNINIVKHLIEKKFMNINVKDTKKNYTGLHLAVVNNRVEVVDYLISFEPMSSIKKCNNETIFNTNIKRPVKSALPEQKKVTDIPIEVQLSKRRSSSALSISQNSDKINRRLSTDSRRKSNQSMSNHLKVPGSGSNLRRISSEVIHEEAKDISIKIENNLPNKPKQMRPRTAYEPITFYSVTEVFKTEPIKFYNNQIIDINSVNNDGQNGINNLFFIINFSFLINFY